MPSVSAYILSYNRPHFLTQAIDSVVNQSRLPDEIIIFDNGSDFDHDSIVDQYRHFDIQFLGSDQNRGPNWNFARALSYSRNDFVFILHDDDVLYPDFVAHNVDYMSRNPSVALTSCNGTVIDDDSLVVGKLFSVVNSNYLTLSNKFDVALRYSNDACIPLSPAFYRVSVLKNVEIKCEYGQVTDAILFFDIVDYGEIALLNQPLFFCRKHSNQDSMGLTNEVLNRQVNYFLTGLQHEPFDLSELRFNFSVQYTYRQFLYLYRFLTFNSNMTATDFLTVMINPYFTFRALTFIVRRSVLKAFGS